MAGQDLLDKRRARARQSEDKDRPARLYAGTRQPREEVAIEGAEQTVDESLVVGRGVLAPGAIGLEVEIALLSRRHSAARACSPLPSRAWANANKSRPRGARRSLSSFKRSSRAARSASGSFGSQERRQPGVRQRESRLFRERGPERLLGRGQVAELLLQPAQVHISRGQVGLKLDRGVVVLASLVEPRFVLQRPAQGDMRRGPIRIQRDHPLPAGDRLGRLFHFVVQLGQPLPEVDVLRARARRPFSATPARRSTGLPCCSTSPRWAFDKRQFRDRAAGLPDKRPWHRPDRSSTRSVLPRL